MLMAAGQAVVEADMPSTPWRPTTPLAWIITIAMAVVAVFILLLAMFILLGVFGMAVWIT